MPNGEKRCPDCQVEPGTRHENGCDIARCKVTGQQHFQCEGEEHSFKGRVYGEHPGECLPTLWTGRWPGDEECEEFGLFVTMESVKAPPWFIKCGPDHPDRTPDLNELGLMAAKGEVAWDSDRERYMKP